MVSSRVAAIQHRYSDDYDSGSEDRTHPVTDVGRTQAGLAAYPGGGRRSKEGSLKVVKTIGELLNVFGSGNCFLKRGSIRLGYSLTCI